MGRLFAFTGYKSYRGRMVGRLLLLIGFAWCLGRGVPAYGTITAISVQSPNLAGSGVLNLTTPVHFQATAESDLSVTGYVIYVDNQNVFQNFVPLLDTWVVLSPGAHSLYIKAWDSSGSLLSTATYAINNTGAAPPNPPANAARVLHIDQFPASWTVDNNPGVGGNCNDGNIGTFSSPSNPNTSNAPDFARRGQHFVVTSKCQYDDSLFYLSDTKNPSPYAGDTNFLWDFWFYIPTTTQTASIEALEHDLFQAVQMSDGVHEFMFGSQCSYATNQFQTWLPQNGTLTWVNAGLSPCQFSTGVWHHATYFLQRVTTSGYQQIPARLSSSGDTNSDLRFGTLTLDGKTMYLGGLSNSTIPENPKWSPVLGVQHQIDSRVAEVTIEEYLDNESLTAW